MYKFCKANGCWWLVCKDPETLLEHEDKTSHRYGIALIKDCENKKSEYSKVIEAAKTLAESNGISVVQGLSELTSRAMSSKIECILEGREVWINNVGGWNLGLRDIEAITYMNNMIFPDCKREDIKITKFGEMEGGKHYYAKIGSIEVCEYVNGEKIIKWDTYDEAYKNALRYCEELD